MSFGGTVPMRPLTVQSPFNAWGVAVLTYLIGLAVILGLGFVLGMVGFLVLSAMGFTGSAEGLVAEDLLVPVVAVALVIVAISIAAQAAFIRRRGGARPVAAPSAALAASIVLGVALVVAPISLADPLVLALHAGVEIAVLAKMIDPVR